MSPPKRPSGWNWLLIAAAFVFSALLASLIFALPEHNAKPATRDDDVAAQAMPTPTRLPSRQAMRNWLQDSEQKIAAKAAEYQLDAPRKRDKNGALLPFRQGALPLATRRAIEDALPGSSFELRLFPDVAIRVRVNGVWRDELEKRVVASIEGMEPGNRWSMSFRPDATRGLVELPAQNRAYEILLSSSGAYIAKEWLYTDVVCARPSPDADSADSGMPQPLTAPVVSLPPISSASVPLRNSRHGAVAVIYLDFDGEIVTGSSWANGATINALPARMNATQIEETWRRVSNHFRVFDVNVTTDRTIYNAAPANRRTHCVITPTDTAARGAGGVAYLNSFTNPSNLTKVCWTFVDQVPADSALVCSHEIGHTLGLYHHGRVASGSSPREEYYQGHGTGETSWGPFMGAPYGKNLLQWSKGEYARANNSAQNDLAVISTPTQIPFIADDHGGTPATATSIQSGASVAAQVGQNTDSDFFFVELDTGPQPVNVTLPAGTMLDAEIRIYAANGDLLQTVNPAATLAASTTIQFEVWEDVYVEIRGVGKPPVTGDGYSNYSSLGDFTLVAGSGGGTGPALALSPTSLPGFRANEGASSASAPFIVRARRLTGPITVSAQAPYQVSLDNAAFSASVQPAPEASVHVRMGAGAAPGVVRRTLQVTSPGATPRSMPLVGLVFGPPGGTTGFVQEALDKLHYFDPADPPSSKFQNDYVLQFADYLDFLEARLLAGVPDQQARVETIMRMMGYRANSGLFEHTSGYTPVATAFGAVARLGMAPDPAATRNFVRSTRLLDERPVPVTVPATGFNGFLGSPWGASRGMAAAFRDFFASRAFRDRYGDLRLLSSAQFATWLSDNMFPGRSLGMDGGTVMMDLLDNGFAADYSNASERRAMARGAAAAFRSVYATFLLTQASITSANGNSLEAPFQRKLHLAALRYQLLNQWDFTSASPDLSPERIAEVLVAPRISAPASFAPSPGADVAFGISLVDPPAPINSNIHFSASWPDGTVLPAAASVSSGGQVAIPAGILRPGTHQIAVHAEGLGGKTTRLVQLTIPSAGLGADWMATHGLQGTVSTAAHSDGDAYGLAAEYAFGLDPLRSDNSAYSVQLASDGYTSVEWNALSTGATYVVEESSDLATWAPVANLAAPQDLGPVGEFHRRKRASIVRAGDRKFYRVSAQIADE